MAVSFFTDFSAKYPGMYPCAVEHETADGQKEKRIEPSKTGSEIQAGFFDMWLTENPRVRLDPVPADMVMASGSGLDPHITLDNAMWQLENRVAAAWAKKTRGDEAAVRGRIVQLLHAHRSAPLGGLVGVPLVNVLEMNLALRREFGG